MRIAHGKLPQMSNQSLLIEFSGLIKCDISRIGSSPTLTLSRCVAAPRCPGIGTFWH